MCESKEKFLTQRLELLGLNRLAMPTSSTLNAPSNIGDPKEDAAAKKKEELISSYRYRQRLYCRIIRINIELGLLVTSVNFHFPHLLHIAS